MSSNSIAAEFLSWYAANLAASQAAAAALEKYFAQLLADQNHRPLIVTARAKAVSSVRGKLLRKPYKRPRSQLTDRVGVRIVLYHGREVDEVARLVRERLIVKEAHSSDKRLALGLREFGYRSYHLVGTLPDNVTNTLDLITAKNQTFEVQIRSLLEHVWAEIEHDVVYKSGAEWPGELKRRFASLAGVLELLEHEFEQLEVAGTGLVERALEALEDRQILTLDVPTMCAVLETEYPSGLSFRRARELGTPFPPGIELLLHLALKRGGLSTSRALQRSLRSRAIGRYITRYAAYQGMSREDVSHLAIITLLIALRTPLLFRVFFPEFLEDAALVYATRPGR